MKKVGIITFNIMSMVMVVNVLPEIIEVNCHDKLSKK